MNKIAVLLMCLLGITLNNVNAQTRSFEDVVSVQLRNTGPILSEGEVKGYYSFYQLDKIDRKTNSYILSITDQNFNEVATKKFIDNSNISLREATYNGSSLFFKFFNTKTSDIIYRRVDDNGELLLEKTIQSEGGAIAQMWNAGGQDPDNVSNLSIFAIDDVGFVGYNFIKGKKLGYSMKFTPENSETKSWTVNSSADSKLFEYATFFGGDEEIVMSLITKKKGIMSKDTDAFLKGVDTKTGKSLFEKSLADNKYDITPMNFFKNNKGEFVVLGVYFEKGEKELKANSLGLVTFSIDKDGSLGEKRYLSWANDVSKFLPVDEKGKMKDAGFIYFHKIVQMADGKIYVVGEQYQKDVGALGALKVLTGGGGGTVKMLVRDLVVFEFDENFNLKNIDIHEKTESNVQVPGYQTSSPHILALMLKAFGGFDYAFSQMSKDNSTFTIGYKDLEKNENAEKRRDKRKLIFGALTYSPEGVSKDKLSLETESSGLRIYPAKPGYVAISEYFKDEKRLDFRLEKINQ